MEKNKTLQKIVNTAEFFLEETKKINPAFGWSISKDDVTNLPSTQQHKLDAVRILHKTKENYAYVSCDVSDFKYVNETYGYTYGNNALKHIAAVFREELRKGELVSRTTGDHFCILLRYKRKEFLEQRILQMLKLAAEFPEDEHGTNHQAVFKCGVYLIQRDDDINMIRARANAARKKNEKGFQNQVVFYNEMDFAEELETKELETEIGRALDRRELQVYLQPKYDIMSEHVIGAEALVRWRHPEKGMLAPGKFIPACEENGSIREVDFYVLEEVCKQLSQWKSEGKKLIKVSTNFSRRHLADKNFVDRLIETVYRYSLEPKNLEIELTESAAYNEMETLLSVMRRIKEAGFGLSMDDFGTGYSSLSLLREMPVDVLKLDKGFLDGCEGFDEATVSRDKRIISHIISMAKDLDISVLAEGVETVQQKEFLKASHCDMIQGYFYAKPMPSQCFAKYLENYAIA